MIEFKNVVKSFGERTVLKLAFPLNRGNFIYFRDFWHWQVSFA